MKEKYNALSISYMSLYEPSFGAIFNLWPQLSVLESETQSGNLLFVNQNKALLVHSFSFVVLELIIMIELMARSGKIVLYLLACQTIVSAPFDAYTSFF